MPTTMFLAPSFPSLRAAALLTVLALVPSCTSRLRPDTDAGRSDAPGPDVPLVFDGGTDAPIPTSVIFLEPGAPIDSPDRFEAGSGVGMAPTIAYPLDGVMLPPNLAGVEVHFLPAGHALFEVSFAQGDAVRMVVYDDCTVRGEGCALALSDPMWAVLEEARAGGPYTVQIRGLSIGGEIGTSDAITVELADEAVTGGLYFWSTEPPAIHRYDFDRAHPVSEVFYDERDSGGACVGCHALARDGRTIAIGYGTEGPITLVDVASRGTSGSIAGPMSAFSPDATELVMGGIPEPDATSLLQVVRADGTGAPIELGVGTGPDWSPDGTTIVATLSGGAVGRWDLTAGSWTSGAPLTDGSTLDVFPSFAPGSHWIAFSRRVESAGAGGFEASVWATERDGASPRRLARASRGRVDSMPRWNPSPFLHRGQTLFWLTFTSDMPYGVDPHDGRQRSIWMAAFAPGSSEPDPSRPAFRLPGQPVTGSNFIPQWTSTVERQTCEGDGDCRESEMCEGGVCVPRLE